ncbi:unnamed protein product [Urochloa humidicola]
MPVVSLMRHPTNSTAHSGSVPSPSSLLSSSPLLGKAPASPPPPLPATATVAPSPARLRFESRGLGSSAVLACGSGEDDSNGRAGAQRLEVAPRHGNRSSRGGRPWKGVTTPTMDEVVHGREAAAACSVGPRRERRRRTQPWSDRGKLDRPWMRVAAPAVDVAGHGRELRQLAQPTPEESGSVGRSPAPPHPPPPPPPPPTTVSIIPAATG